MVPTFAELLEDHLTCTTLHPFQAKAGKCQFSPLSNQKLATPMCQLFTILCSLPLGSWPGIMTYILEVFVLFSITEKEDWRQQATWEYNCSHPILLQLRDQLVSSLVGTQQNQPAQLFECPRLCLGSLLLCLCPKQTGSSTFQLRSFTHSLPSGRNNKLLGLALAMSVLLQRCLDEVTTLHAW